MKKQVKKKLKKLSNNKTGWLCSGYKVAPNGEVCKGCIDCNFGKDKRTIQKVFNDTHMIVRIPSKRKKK